VISDLLKPDKVNLMIREDRRRGVFVDGLSEWVVRSPGEVYGLMMRGAQQVRERSPPNAGQG
jgi:kinesin family protein 3/17